MTDVSVIKSDFIAHDDLNVNFMQKIICDVNKILFLAVISESFA